MLPDHSERSSHSPVGKSHSDGDEVVGIVTSGGLATRSGKPIAYGYLPSVTQNRGTRLRIEVAAKKYDAVVEKSPSTIQTLRIKV